MKIDLIINPCVYQLRAWCQEATDAGAAGISTAGEKQVKALQKKLTDIKVNTSTAGQHSVRFGDNPETLSLGTIGVETPFGTIYFAVMPTNTPFLLCLSDMD